MQSPDSQIIVRRFFEALQNIIAGKVIRSKQTFTSRYSINRRNLYLLEKDNSRDIFQPAWLLTGEGPFFKAGWDAQQVSQLNKKTAKTRPPIKH